MTPGHNYLIVSALGTHRAGIVSELSRTYAQYGCQILSAKINLLGQELAAFFLLAGNWGAIARLEAALPALEQKLSIALHSRRTQEVSSESALMSYTAHIIAVDRPGILNELMDLFQKETVLVEEVCTNTYINHSHTTMLNLQLKIHIPTSTHLANLRDTFMNYCDQHNFEGFLEPVRN